MSGLVALVSDMCRLNGVSGSENEVRDFIRERVMAFADQIHEDAMGSLLLFKRGRSGGGKPRMVCAHMDEVGLIVRKITEDGFLKVYPVGGVSPEAVLGKRVLVGPERIPGVVCVTPKHLLPEDGKMNLPSISEMVIDIGAENREEAERLTAVGDDCAFVSAPNMLSDRIFSAKAIDDRLGCAIVMRLVMEEEPAADTWFVFSAQEELGGRGARGAAAFIDPSEAGVAEATTAADLPGTPSHKRVCPLGGGGVVPAADRGTLYDGTLRTRLITLAEAYGIPWQDKEALAGGTDAGSIHTGLNGIPCATLAAPVRYLHGPHCIADVNDFEAMYRLLRAYVSGKR